MHPSLHQGSKSIGKHDSVYEIKTLIMLGLGLGLVGLDRWIVASYLFAGTGPNAQRLFVLLFGVSAFALGLPGLLSGPIATEAAPAGLVASSVGFVSGAGEIFGGGLAPAAAGFVAQHSGLASTLTFALGGLIAGGVVSPFLAETSPRMREQVARTAAVGLPEDVT